MIAKILLPLPLNEAFSYIAHPSLKVGDWVKVSFGNRLCEGVVWELASNDEDSSSYTLKEIHSLLSGLSPLPSITKEFIHWVASYTMTPLGLILKMVTGSLKLSSPPKKMHTYHALTKRPHEVRLNEEQQEAYNRLCEAQNQFTPFLLDGVTGSGKTEVYLSVMETIMQEGQVLVLLPEIGLTSQWLDRFKRRFGVEPYQWHSGLTSIKRYHTWKGVANGQISVIVGTRSALFLPFSNLKLIIVDEEHDPSYKQEEQVIYNARDMAVVRAQLSNIPVILASATPSIETLSNVDTKRYQSISLTQRHAGATFPTVHLIDMSVETKKWISGILHNAMIDALNRKEQVLLFLNRRGFAPLLLCKSCGHKFSCIRCSATLVEHLNGDGQSILKCHHCGYRKPKPSTCTQCEAQDSLVSCGPGVEKIESIVRNLFPNANICVLSTDTAKTPKQLTEIVQAIEKLNVDIIIGTQMITKGYHFPKLSVVGVIDADLGLVGGDLRGCERTYQLLHQVAGRAGREKEISGHVYLQTYYPSHPVMKALQHYDRDTFFLLEKEQRQENNMPPFGRLASVILTSHNQAQLDIFSHKLKQSINYAEGITVLGPVPAPLSRINKKYRYRFLCHATRRFPLQHYIDHWLKKIPCPSHIRLTIDIDPYNFY